MKNPKTEAEVGRMISVEREWKGDTLPSRDSKTERVQHMTDIKRWGTDHELS